MALNDNFILFCSPLVASKTMPDDTLRWAAERTGKTKEKIIWLNSVMKCIYNHKFAVDIIHFLSYELCISMNSWIKKFFVKIDILLSTDQDQLVSMSTTDITTVLLYMNLHTMYSNMLSNYQHSKIHNYNQSVSIKWNILIINYHVN